MPGLGVLSVDRTVDQAGGGDERYREIRVDGHGTLVVSEGPRNEIKPKQRGDREREGERERESEREEAGSVQLLLLLLLLPRARRLSGHRGLGVKGAFLFSAAAGAAGDC